MKFRRIPLPPPNPLAVALGMDQFSYRLLRSWWNAYLNEDVSEAF